MNGDVTYKRGQTICGRCGTDKQDTKVTMMGCVAEIIVICGDCEKSATQSNIPWFEWMDERYWRAAVDEARKLGLV